MCLKLLFLNSIPNGWAGCLPTLNWLNELHTMCLLNKAALLWHVFIWMCTFLNPKLSAKSRKGRTLSLSKEIFNIQSNRWVINGPKLWLQKYSSYKCQNCLLNRVRGKIPLSLTIMCSNTLFLEGSDPRNSFDRNRPMMADFLCRQENVQPKMVSLSIPIQKPNIRVNLLDICLLYWTFSCVFNRIGPLNWCQYSLNSHALLYDLRNSSQFARNMQETHDAQHHDGKVDKWPSCSSFNGVLRKSFTFIGQHAQGETRCNH